MENSEQYVAVPLQLFNKVIEYISNKPYNEVNVIMQSLQENAKVIEAKEQIEEDPSDES
jgi:hypothetical protein